eukprot:XP_011674093.1 PREDICTED: cysteine string protein-like [Strongylocentrotus purpuratus]
MADEINRAHRILTDENKRQVYDKYGTLGLYLVDNFGDADDEENDSCIDSKCFMITAIICFVATGCCCCCCCFFCFWGCCGRFRQCVPDLDDEDGDLTNIDGGSTDGGDTDEPVMNQPEASGGVNNDVFAMPDPADQ